MTEKDKFFKMYLENRYWIFGANTEFPVGHKDEELLLGHYDGYNFPIIYNEMVGVRPFYDEPSLFQATHFLKTNHGGRNFAVSDEVIELFYDNHITGWKTYPVEVYTLEGDLIAGYNGFTITGRCRAVKPSLIEKEIIIPPTYKNGPSYPGYLGDPLDLDTWDESDIFILEHTTYKYVTKRVKKVLDELSKRELTNVLFEDIADRPIIQNNAIWKSNMGVVITE